MTRYVLAFVCAAVVSTLIPTGASGEIPGDADSDGDADVGEAVDGDGAVDALDPDSDNDGVGDGTELGRTHGVRGTALATRRFIPDADPSSRSDPKNRGSDAAGAPDGQEDANGNGWIDDGETSPLDPTDDADAPPPMPEPGVGFEPESLRARSGVGCQMRPSGSVPGRRAGRRAASGGGRPPQTTWRWARRRRRSARDPGVAAERLIPVGKGEGEPIDSNRDAEGRAANRRVELHVE